MQKLAKYLLNALPRPILIRLSLALRPLLYLWFRGKDFTDPIDKRSYRKFLPYGYGTPRPGALAPGTLSLERHRQMWLYLEKETSFFSDSLKVLHMAPEQAFFKRFKRMKNLHYVSADLYSPIVDVKADLLQLPFENEEFDVVFCNHVLEHIVEDRKAMSELYRVLKPGGWGILQVPLKRSEKQTYEDFSITDPKERQIHFGQYDHVRWYGMDYFTRLESVGFEVEVLEYSKNFSKQEQKRYGLSENEILPIVRKK
ncbi:class I SAM-dependent methyltransferase [Chryseobacterium sp. A301]